MCRPSCENRPIDAITVATLFSERTTESDVFLLVGLQE